MADRRRAAARGLRRRACLGRGVAACAALWGLAGCAIPTERGTAAAAAADDALPSLAPPPHVAIRPDLPIDRWWTLLDDPALTALIESALARNHDLAVAAARVREARARLDASRARELPWVGLEASSGRSHDAADGPAPAGLARTHGRHQVQLVAQHEVDLWGRLAQASAAERERLLAERWARASIAFSLTAQLAEAHCTLRAVQRQIEIAAAVAEGRLQTAALRRRELQAGLGSSFALHRAEAEAAEARGRVATLQRRRASLEATLALLEGRPAADVAATEAPRVPLQPLPPDRLRLPAGDASAMLRARPDVQRAEALLAAARHDVAAARAATWPSLTLSGRLGSDAAQLAHLFSGPAALWSLAAGLALPLVDGGERRARVEAEEARADAAAADYRRVALAAVLELREAYATLEIAAQARAARQERVQATAAARALAGRGQASGALGALDLLDADRQHLEASLDEVAAWRDEWLAQIAAFKALGGGTGDGARADPAPA